MPFIFIGGGSRGDEGDSAPSLFFVGGGGGTQPPLLSDNK